MRPLLLALLLTACTVGTLPTPPTPTGTPWPTNTPSPTVTVEPTPTRETICSPHYWAVLWGYTSLYANPDLTVLLRLDGYEVVLVPGTTVLLQEAKGYAYRVVTADGERVEGWIPFYVLPVECH